MPGSDKEGYRTDLMIRKVAEPGSIAGQIMRLVQEKPGATTKEIAAAVGVSRGHASVVVHRLRVAGLVAPLEEGTMGRVFPV